MKRLMAFVVAPVFLAVICILVLIALGLMVNELKRPQPAVVHLKKDVVQDGETREGEIAKSDKYVTVTTASHGVEVFTWDQILYITEKEPAASRKLDRVVDLIDLLSKLGIAATFVFFMIGLYQYSQTQKWEREKFLAAQVKEFVELIPARNARLLVESLDLHKKGRMIELFPEAADPKERKTFVSDEEIYVALATDPRELDDHNDRVITIRDCFDTYFSYLGMFNHFIEQGLITEVALYAHLGYWIQVLGTSSKLEEKYKDRIRIYLEKNNMDDLLTLIRRYEGPPSRLEKIKQWLSS